MNSQISSNTHERAHKFIPAGAHTYSRADYQFPSNAPKFVERAEAAYFWDEKGQKYLDYGMGILSVSIGHAHPYINERIINTIAKGNSYSRPSLQEGALAEKLNALIPSAEMVKFAKKWF
ncbi:MAG: aminotransferase class III-fold pyridoxal phosphate-dependent enzyme [Bacteroidia bacterium]